jgi:copper chaperone
MKTEKFIVNNMKCMGCVNNVKTGLIQLDGVTEVYIDLSKSEVTVNYLAEKLKSEDIVKKLNAIGYPVKG